MDLLIQLQASAQVSCAHCQRSAIHRLRRGPLQPRRRSRHRSGWGVSLQRAAHHTAHAAKVKGPGWKIFSVPGVGGSARTVLAGTRTWQPVRA